MDQHAAVDKLIVPGDIAGFNLESIKNIALDYVNEADFIIFTSDIDTKDFPKNKIIGNADTESINDKFKLYKLLHKNFLLPKTYKLNSIDEARDIANNYPQKKFIIKPIKGYGGLGIDWFDEDMAVDDEFLLQEFIQGDAVSSYFLSNLNHDVEFITVSEQIIGSKQLGASDFTYCGNINPYVNANTKISNISSKIAKMCKLIGSNGVDFIVSNNNVYVLEVNPRISGSYECVENSFQMNLVKEHINSCNNEQLNVPTMKQFSIKLIPYSTNQGRYNLNNISDVHDISKENYIFKKGEPISTIITSDRILENAMGKAQRVLKSVYDSFKPI